MEHVPAGSQPSANTEDLRGPCRNKRHVWLSAHVGTLSRKESPPGRKMGAGDADRCSLCRLPRWVTFLKSPFKTALHGKEPGKFCGKTFIWTQSWADPPLGWESLSLRFETQQPTAFFGASLCRTPRRRSSSAELPMCFASFTHRTR